MTAEDQFNAFARKLADLVMVAINSGKRLSRKPSYDTVCPLGCIPGVLQPRPTGGEVRSVMPEAKDLPHMAPTAFADGFDGSARCAYVNECGVGKYYDLGQEYARRWP